MNDSELEKIIKRVLKIYYNFSIDESDKAFMIIKSIIQDLEKVLKTPLKLTSLHFDENSNIFELYFRYPAPLISISALFDYESEILAKIHKKIPRLKDNSMISDSWGTGFGLSLRHGKEKTVYLSIISKTNPITIDDLLQLMSIMEHYENLEKVKNTPPHDPNIFSIKNTKNQIIDFQI